MYIYTVFFVSDVLHKPDDLGITSHELYVHGSTFKQVYGISMHRHTGSGISAPGLGRPRDASNGVSAAIKGAASLGDQGVPVDNLEVERNSQGACYQFYTGSGAAAAGGGFLT